MPDVSLENVIALNEELAALSAAGVAIDLGDTHGSLESTLAKVNSNLALRASQGESVYAALSESDDLPTAYQNALLASVETNEPSLVLEGVTRQAIANNEMRSSAGYSLLQPLIVFALAYCGFIFLCLYFSPTLERIYGQMRETPNLGVRFLATCREWMPIWAPLVPLLVGLAIEAWKWRSGSRRIWLPGSRKYFSTINHATFAEQAASLLESQVAVPESLRIAAKATNDTNLASAVETVALAHNQTEPLSPADYKKLSSLPPFLRWVLTSNSDRDSLAQMLRFAAETYRRSADRQEGVWYLLLPTVIAAVLGGAIVFAFALVMFGTYIALLYDLAL